MHEGLQVQTPEELLIEVLPGFESYELLSELMMSRIKFFEKTLIEWTTHLAIDVPENTTPQDLRNLFVRVAKNIQQASYFYSICGTYNGTLTSKVDGQKASTVAKLVVDYANKNAKRPAATVLDSVAESYLNDVSLQLVISRVLKEFWKERRDTLIEVRKCLEAIGMSQNMEMKYHESL